ncbi:MAG: Uma2 family endonuclease [Kovacikia sp.]
MLGIPEYWIVDYRALGGRRYIGSPKVPTVSVYVLVDEVYQLRQFRAGDAIASSIFPELRLTAAEILTVVE